MPLPPGRRARFNRPNNGPSLSARSHAADPREQTHCSCNARLEAALQEQDRKWEERLESLEDTLQAEQCNLHRRIVGLEREVVQLRDDADLCLSMSEPWGDDDRHRIANAVVHLSNRINTLDRAAAHFSTDFGALRKALLAIDHGYAPSTAGSFPHFTKLPLELREMVWQLAMPRGRVHTVSRHFGSWWRQHGPPALAHACREARRVACRTGRGAAFWQVYDTIYECDRDRDWAAEEADWWNPRWGMTWFDARHDVLRFPAAGDCWDAFHVEYRLGDFFQRVENVMLYPYEGGVNSISCLPYLMHPAYFPKLKLVQLEVPSVRSLLAGQTTTIGEEEIFGQKLDGDDGDGDGGDGDDGDGPFYIDLDDEELVQRIAENIQNCRPGGWSRPTADEWLQNIRAAREGWYEWAEGVSLGPPAERWAGFQNWLSHYWLTSLEQCTPLSSKDVIARSSGSRKQVRWDHPWIQAVKKHIPVFQRVAKIRRDCDINDW